MQESTIPLGLERRKEDYQLITGRARFVDDIRLSQDRPPMLYMTLVRSPYAHARITNIRPNAAIAIPGVVTFLTGTDLADELHPLDIAIPLPGLKKPERRPLAQGKVRYAGDPVAIILAESPAIAEDARDLVEVDYEPLQPVVDPEAAMESGTALLYEDFGSNIAFSTHSGQGDLQAIFARADRTISLRLVNQRVAPSSLEPRACLFDYDSKEGKLTGWVSSQGVYRMREALSSMLGIDRDSIHIMNAEVGGGFGSKNGFVGEEFVAAWLAVKYGRPVK
ncbi:MAG TPA: molybdopterin cofactor-binding domain-containing protein, partial [Ktedonobacteraceae bacterium]|nr:molybdopterin cofactor-binding domain-containing protein [Ktedonobacteraceae bacterium]